MSVSNGIISAPISIDDVNNVLGHGSTDLGTLCTSSKIKKWSRYKPIRNSSPGILDDVAFETDIHEGGNTYDIYGMQVSILHSMLGNGWTQQSKITSIANDTTGFFYKLAKKTLSEWLYLLPRSGTDWLRLTDFGGYNNNATSPMPKARAGTYKMSPAGAVNISIDEPSSMSFEAGCLSLQDLAVPSAISVQRPKLGTLYRGILFYTDALTDVFFVSEATPGLGHVALANNNYINMTSHAGKWKARTFFCNRKVELCNTSWSETDYFIPSGEAESSIILYNDGSPYVVEITTAKFVDSNRSQANIVARVTAYAETLTLTGISIEYYTGVVWETATTFSNTSLQAGGEYKNFSYTGGMLGAKKARFNVTVNGTAKSVESTIS